MMSQIGDCCHVDSGPAFKSSDFLRGESGIRLLRGDNIEPGGLRWLNTRRWPESNLAPYRHLLVELGDLILGMDRPLISSGLKLAMVKERDLPALLVQRVARIRPIDIDSRFLYYWLQAPSFSAHLSTSATGTQLPHVTLRTVREFPVPRFGEAQERRIVEILEDHLSRLDAAHSGLAFSSRRLQALIKSELASRIPSPDGAPATWSWTTVAGAGRVDLGRQRHPDWHTGPNMQPYLRVANVFEDRIDTSDLMTMHWPGATFDRFRLSPGDVLLNEGQSPELLGRPALYRGDPPRVAFTNSLLRFVANPDVLPEFALLVFRRHMHTGRFRRESRITTNIGHLSASRLKTIEFPIPPLVEQQWLVQAALQRLQEVSRLLAAVEGAQRRSSALRRAVLAAAFSGRLTGRRTDEEVIEEIAEARP